MNFTYTNILNRSIELCKGNNTEFHDFLYNLLLANESIKFIDNKDDIIYQICFEDFEDEFCVERFNKQLGFYYSEYLDEGVNLAIWDYELLQEIFGHNNLLHFFCSCYWIKNLSSKKHYTKTFLGSVNILDQYKYYNKEIKPFINKVKEELTKQLYNQDKKVIYDIIFDDLATNQEIDLGSDNATYVFRWNGEPEQLEILYKQLNKRYIADCEFEDFKCFFSRIIQKQPYDKLIWNTKETLLVYLINSLIGNQLISKKSTKKWMDTCNVFEGYNNRSLTNTANNIKDKPPKYSDEIDSIVNKIISIE